MAGEEQMSSKQRSERRQVVKFTDVAEFTDELARDAELVERRIVRLTQEARAAEGGAFHLLVHAGAVIEGQLVCLTAYAGQHWGEGMLETRQGYQRATELQAQIRSALPGSRARDAPRRVRGAAAMTTRDRRLHPAADLSAVDARVLRELPMTNAPGTGPTAEQTAARLSIAVDVAHSSLRRLRGRDLAEHDGARPPRWARTARAEQALELQP
jgi:hypothetical protein